MKTKTLTMALACTLCISLTCPAFAVGRTTEAEIAADYLRSQGIMLGDPGGDMQLERSLTRAELATLMTRLHGGAEVEAEFYTWACYFPDVPAWAKPYVGYCVATLLMNGYGPEQFAPDDLVSPAMACTVVLRACGHKTYEGSAWSYSTSCSYAVSLGLIDQNVIHSAAITRGDMAVLVYRALQPQEELVPAYVAAPAPADAYVTAPDGSLSITADHWSREDFSRQANPAVFLGPYTRELYNTVRQTILDAGSQDSAGYRYAYSMVSKADYSAVVNAVGRLNGTLRYEHYVPAGLTNYYAYLDYYAVSARMPEVYQAAHDFIQPVVLQVSGMRTDRDKVTYLNNYLCTLLTYHKDKDAGIPQIFAPHSREIEAACSSYAIAFKFLCHAAGIPCFTVSSSDHTWNLVYVEGQWLNVDVTNNDHAGTNYILLTKTVGTQTDRAPDATAFLKELLVPGSTK